MSFTNRPLLSLSQIIRNVKLPGCENKTAVAVETVIDDVPKLKVCARRVSQAGSHILKAGNKILTFNLLALESSGGGGTMLLSGPQKGRGVPAF